LYPENPGFIQEMNCKKNSAVQNRRTKRIVH
jgi:ribosome-associated protein YbcJ (S4-like RNA binding protein)